MGRAASGCCNSASEVESRKASLEGLAQELRQVNLRTDELEGQIRQDVEALAAVRKERTEFSAELLRLAEQGETARARETELVALVDERKAQCDALAQQLAAQSEAAGKARLELEKSSRTWLIAGCGASARRPYVRSCRIILLSASTSTSKRSGLN